LTTSRRRYEQQKSIGKVKKKKINSRIKKRDLHFQHFLSLQNSATGKSKPNPETVGGNPLGGSEKERIRKIAWGPGNAFSSSKNLLQRKLKTQRG